MNDPITRSPEQQLSDFISNHALPIPSPGDLILDGKEHRFGKGEKYREPHWYVGSRNGERISLTVGCHKNPEMKSSFHSKKPSSLKPRWQNGSLGDKWHSCETQESHSYLTKKGISSGLFGAKINYSGNLIVPMHSIINGELVGLQSIKKNGNKRYLKGSKKTKSYFEIQGAIEKKDVVYVAEGFATAVSVYMATKARVICAFDCANLTKIVRELSKKEPKTMIIIAADDDRFGETNHGRMAANIVSRIASAVFPVFSSDEGKPTDWNDLHALEGLEVVKKQIEKDSQFKKQIEKDSQFKKKTETSEKTNKKISSKTTKDRPKILIGSAIDESESLETKDNVLPGLMIGDIGILCAPGGYGKSGIALLIADQIACGGTPDFLGFGPLSGGAACILTLEDRSSVFGERQRAISKDLSKEQIEKRNKNISLIDCTSCAKDISPTEIVNYIKDIVDENDIRMRLLVIDHLTYWSQVDLNDGGQVSELMQEFRAMASELGCSILLLHHSNRSGMLKGKDKPAISSTIGGSYKLHSLSRWAAFIDQPSKQELKEKFDTDGHEGEYKTLCVDKVNCGKKVELLLKHNEDRLGLLYKHEFATSDSLNLDSIGVDLNRDQDDSIRSALIEEAARFNMCEASPKLATIDEDKHHIMNWITRNCVFENISSQRRAKLTKVANDGTVLDKDREEPSVYRDVWADGDMIVVSGPVCDYEDMKLYNILVKNLTDFHRNGFRGLEIEVSQTSLLKSSGRVNSGKNGITIKRQLSRLSGMVIDFRNLRGHRWKGPLLAYVAVKGRGRGCKIRIGFNEFMVAFYKIQEYTFLQRSVTETLKGRSLAFYIFYASQNLVQMKVSASTFLSLLGIGPCEKKEARRIIKKSLEELVKAGVMDERKTCLKGDVVHTYRSERH